MKPVIGITIGDPCGIGPEVTLRAIQRRRRSARFAVFGSSAVLQAVAGKFNIPIPSFSSAGDFSGNGPFLCEAAVTCPSMLAACGRPTAVGGRTSAEWIALAVDAALCGKVGAIVTAPVSKLALHMAGMQWAGHTEMLAGLTSTQKPVMMMAGGGIRAALVTTHAAIRDLPRLVTRAETLRTIQITADELRRRFGIRNPRLLVCGLNPHAGERGRFGDEERRAIAPAIRAAKNIGIQCAGPIPADVAFTPAKLASCDAVIAMFHDQATIPVKMLAFESGVNITLGLPIIRTSPDHGTAYDIAAKGVANAGSMVAAIDAAIELVSRS